MLREKGLRPAFLGLYGLFLFCRRCVGAGQPGTTSTQAMGRGKKPRSSGTEGSEHVYRSCWEAASQASVWWSKGMASSGGARLSGYLSESYLPAEHSSGRDPGNKIHNQPQF